MPTQNRCPRPKLRYFSYYPAQKLALACGIVVACIGSLNAQEPAQEPPRIFRGGIVQQLRSLTEDAFQTQRPEAKKNNSKSTSDAPERPLDLPKPPALNSSVKSGKINANSPVSNSGPRTPTRSTTSSNSVRDQTTTGKRETAGPSRIHSNLQSQSRTPYRSPDAGVPVTNPSLAKEAHFRLDDRASSSSNGRVYTSNSKYDGAVDSSDKDSPATKLVAGEPAQVQAVEITANAPKVSRRPLPGSSAAKPQIDAEQSSKSNTSVARVPTTQSKPKSEPAAIPVPLAPTEPKLSSPPTETSYPSLGITSSAKTSPASTGPTSTGPTSTGPTSTGPAKTGPAPKTTSKDAIAKKTSTAEVAGNSVNMPSTSSEVMTSYPLLPPTNLQVNQQTTIPPRAPGFELPSAPVALPGKHVASTLGSSAQDDRSKLPQNSNPIRNDGVGSIGDEHLSMETPRLQVLLKGPGNLAVGSPVDYQIQVRNQDSIALDGIVLRLEIPIDVAFKLGKPSHGEFQTEKSGDGTTLLSWTFDELAAQRTASAPLQLIANQARNFALAMDWTLMPKSGEAQFEVRQARLELSLEGPSEVEFGTANSYRLNIRNPGTAVAQNVKVNLGAASFGSSEAEVGEIQPGDQQSIEVELTFHERGTISINADAVGAGNLHTEAKIDVLVKQAQLVAELTGADRIYHGTAVTYEAKIQNIGNLDCRDVRMGLTLPSGVEVLDKPINATITGDQLAWTVTAIKPGQTQSFPIQIQMRGAGEHRLALNCSAPHIQPTAASLITTVEAIADLKLVVNDPIAPAPVGGLVSYELSVTNRGSRAATNVKILAQFSEGIEPLKVDGAKHQLVPGQVIFEPIATIAAGETKILKIHAKAEKSGTHRFRAEVKSDESEMRLVQEETTQYLDSAASRIASPMNSNVIR